MDARAFASPKGFGPQAARTSSTRMKLVASPGLL
jgi:hypothetical protein